jgi:UDP-glucuronate 4-epimerase
MPLRISDNTNHPLSFYGATKKGQRANGACLCVAVRFADNRFAVFHGLWTMGTTGHGDVAVHRCDYGWNATQTVQQRRLQRDFTYIDDVTEAIVRLIKRPPEPNPGWSSDPTDPATSHAPWRLYNVGNSRPVELIELVQLIEQAVGRPAIREFLPMQPGDVLGACADSSDLERAVEFRPNTSIEDGTRRFVEWFRAYCRRKE